MFYKTYSNKTKNTNQKVYGGSMKRFLIIFAICIGSLTGVLGGYIGVKYLLGHFDPEIIAPEQIEFNCSNGAYYFYDGDTHTITINATNENVTQKVVNLTLAPNAKDPESPRTVNKNYVTDGVIVIPKTATIGVPFEVTLVKNDYYANELNDDALKNWVVGGVSEIIATAKNGTANIASAKVYVDVPVYKTELVVYNKQARAQTFTSLFKSFENSAFASSVTSEYTPTINAGETFYVGLKFYPSASAYKYSKAISTNMLYNNLQELEGVYEKYQMIQDDESFEQDLLDLLETTNGETPNDILFRDIMNVYEQIVSKQTQNSEFNEDISNLADSFYSCLKEYQLVQIADPLADEANKYKAQELGRVFGTNIYKMRATQNLGELNFLTYVFNNAHTEDLEYSLIGKNPSADQKIDALEAGEASGKSIKTTATLNIQEVQVNNIQIAGEISDFYTMNHHVIYADVNGQNSVSESYLLATLSNTNVPDVNLQDRVKTMGMRFEKESGTTWNATNEIQFKDSQSVTIGEYTYYLPQGLANSWTVYANEGVEGKFRAKIIYMIETNTGYEELLQASEQIQFEVGDVELQQEGIVSWSNTQDKTLKIINISNVYNITTQTIESVSRKQTINLEELVDFETVNANIYKTIRYFIYTENKAINLSTYFNCKAGVEYNDISDTTHGITSLNLFELDSPVLELKDGATKPNFDIYAIFATVKVDIDGKPITQLGTSKYDIVRYSATESVGTGGTLNSIKISFEESLAGIKAKITTNVITNKADVVSGKLTTGQNLENVLKVELTSGTYVGGAFTPDASQEKLSIQIENHNVTIIAMLENVENTSIISTDSNSVDNLINISTNQISGNKEICLFVKYVIDGSVYYIKALNNIHGVDETNQITILEDTSSKAQFAIKDGAEYKTDVKSVDSVSITTTIEGGTLTQKYGVTYTAIDDSEKTNEEEKYIHIFENNIPHVIVKDFLGRISSEPWTLTSDNANVVYVQENNALSFVGNGTAKVTLKLNDTKFGEISYTIENNGYVSSYTTKINGIENPVDFAVGEYKANKITLNDVIANDGNVIYLTGETDPLLKMQYTIDPADPTKTTSLTFDVKLADENSKNVFNAVTNQNATSLELTKGGITNFSINDVGSACDIELIYSCQDVGIVQRVLLKIKPNITITSVEIKDCDTNTITPTSNIYNVYAEEELTISITDHQGVTIPYYYLSINDRLNKIGSNYLDGIPVKVNSGVLTFKDVEKTTNYTIYISNVAEVENAEKIGALKYQLKFSVTPNIKYKTDGGLLNEEGIANITLGSDGTYSIALSEILTRIKGSSGIDATQLEISNKNISEDVVEIDRVNKLLKFKFDSDTKNIVDTIGLELTLKYFKYTVQTQGQESTTKITFNIVPSNYEPVSTKKIALYNGEKAVVVTANGAVDEDTYVPNEIGTIFVGAGKIEIDNITKFGNFLIASGTDYILSDYEDKFFVDTECYLKVYDTTNVNYVTYKIIISHEEFNFNKFYTEGGDPITSYKNLDIYKLFVAAASEIVNYYQLKGIKVGSGNYYGASVIALDSAIMDAAAYTVSLTDGSIAEAYATISGTTLSINHIGENVYLIVRALYDQRSVPFVFKINKSQQLKVTYPYNPEATNIEVGCEDFVKYGEYGSDEYDNIALTEEFKLFDNAPMEYIQFNVVSGTKQATLNLNNKPLNISRFNVYTWDGAGFNELDLTQRDYLFTVQKVYGLANGEWCIVEDFASLVSVTNNFAEENHGLLVVNAGKYSAIRLKIKVTANGGGATGYYYIHAGSYTTPTLYYNGTAIYSATIVNDLNKDDTIVFKEDEVGTHKFYLTGEYVSKLNYKIDDENINTTQVTYTIALLPNGKILTLQLFTIYGSLPTATLRVTPYYTATPKAINIYCGDELYVTDFIDITNTTAGDSITLESVPENEYYSKVSNKIKFKYSGEEYTISNFECTVNIKRSGETEGRDFNIQGLSITVKPLVEAINASDTIDKTEETSKITIGEEDWASNFRVKGNVATGVASFTGGLEVKYTFVSKNGGEAEPAKLVDEQEITVNTILETSEYNFTVYIKAGGVTLAQKTFVVKVNPEYTVTVNYPVANDEEKGTANCEIIQQGAKISFAGTNFNGDKRIVVTKKSDGSEVTFTVKDNNGTEVTDTSVLPAGDYDFGIFVGEGVNAVQYGVYKVHIQTGSPLDVEQKGETLYYGYGESNPLSYADLVVQLPKSTAYGEGVTHLKDGDAFDIVVVYTGDTDVEEVKLEGELIYQTSATNGIRCVLGLSGDPYKYLTGLEKFNAKIYFKYAKAEVAGEYWYVLAEYQLTSRYEIKYNGKIVDKKYYANIVKTDATLDNNEVEFEFNSDIVNDVSNWRILEYDVQFDLQVTKDLSNKFTKTANQISNGESLVGLIGLQDKLGNPIGYNNIAISGYIFNGTCGYDEPDSINNELSPAITQEPTRNFGDEKIYDYTLKYVGAKRTNTNVTLTLTISSGPTQHFTQEIKFEIISDIEYKLVISRGDSSENSGSTPTTISSIGTYTLVNPSQTEADYDNYGIYVTGKYKNGENIASTFNWKLVVDDTEAIGGESNYIDLVGKTGINVKNIPVFGNKNAQIILTDNYGYTITYYIVLVARTTVEEEAFVGNNSSSLYEGDSITIYNKNQSGLIRPENGIALTINGANAGEKIVLTEVKLTEATKEEWGLNSTSVTDELTKSDGGTTVSVSAGIFDGTIVNDNELTFKPQIQKFWETIGTKPVGVVFTVRLDGETDTYSFTKSFNFYRRYSASVSEENENVYVRDGVAFDPEFLISVYDQKTSKRLGEPQISYTDAIVLGGEITLNNETIAKGTYGSVEVEGTDVKLHTIINACISGNPTVTGVTYSVSLTDDAQKISALENFLATQYRMGLSVTKDGSNITAVGISISLNVVATHKQDSSNIITGNFVLSGSCELDADKKITGKIIVDSSSLILMGKDSTTLGEACNINEFNFTLLDNNNKTIVEIIDKEKKTDNKKTTLFGDVSDFTLQLTQVALLEVNVAAYTNILIEYKYDIDPSNNGAEIVYEQLNVSESMSAVYLVEERHLQNPQSIKLFNGVIKSDDTRNTLYDSAGGNFNKNLKLIAGTYFNGLTRSEAQTAKHLYGGALFKDAAGDETTSVNLDTAKDLVYDETKKVHYQLLPVNFRYSFEGGIYYETAVTLKVTTAYTGVDTSNAYVSTAEFAIVNYEYANAEGDVTVELADWSQNMTLVPGVGIVSTIAKQIGEDLTFNNADYNTGEYTQIITYKLEKVADGGASLISLNETNGLITLKEAFRENEANYHVDIAIYCSYPNKKAGGAVPAAGSVKPVKIGTITLHFKGTPATPPAS